MITFSVGYNDFAALGVVAEQIIHLAGEVKAVTIQGELGAGKTSLVQAICARLGVTDPVSSPTFTFVNEYYPNNGECIYHLDMYRLEHEADAIQLGLGEYFRQCCWCFIEWPEKIASFLPDNFVSLKIEVDPLNHDRKISLRMME